MKEQMNDDWAAELIEKSDAKFAALAEEQQFSVVFSSIKCFAKDRNLTPLEVKEIFSDGIIVNYQNGKLKRRPVETKELENFRANRS